MLRPTDDAAVYRFLSPTDRPLVTQSTCDIRCDSSKSRRRQCRYNQMRCALAVLASFCQHRFKHRFKPVGLNLGLNRFKPSWQKQFSTRVFEPVVIHYPLKVIFPLVRPPDIVCRRTYILPVFLSSSSFFLSFFLLFFRRLISEVTERN